MPVHQMIRVLFDQCNHADSLQSADQNTERNFSSTDTYYAAIISGKLIDSKEDKQ